MTIATLAYGARQSLARGLEALQAVDAPPALLDVAQPVARAMGMLVEIETAPDGLMVAARVGPALDALREGLRLLQLPEHLEHPAAARGMAAVAETLGAMVELVSSLDARPVPPPQQPFRREVAVERAPLSSPTLTTAVIRTLAPTRTSAEPAVVAQAVNAVLAPASEAVRVPSVVTRTINAVHAPPSSEVVTASVAPRAPAAARPPEPKVVVADAARSAIVREEIRRDRELRTLEASLGANSPTNFYTGLAGGEVITAGGLFVATYQLPKLGETILLEVNLPGGYEFLAKAIVAWTRSAGGDTSSGSMRAAAGPPGFGARFAEVTEEGRRLIQRYVKNREPLFHDD
jgi:Tfp pilus assembly protein PilZ